MDGVHLNNLNGFRAGLYDTFRRWSDALFETCDATLCATAPVTSLPMLSLEPVSRRSHGSLYRSLAEGEIDTEAFNDLLMAHRPTDWPDVFAVDASTWARCDAETSPQRGFYYSASKHSAGQPIVAGWSYEWTCQLNWEPNSWTAPIDVGRIDPNTNALDQTITRIRRLTERLDCDNPTFVLDAGYDPIALTHHLADTNAHIVVRIRSDRVFYNNPPAPEPHTTGRPRRHGTRHECANPDTWPEPDRTHTTHDNRYGTITINAWDGLHPKLGRKKGSRWADFDQPPIIAGTVISVSVDHLPKNVASNNKTLWLWATSPHQVDIDLAARAYLRRFDIEHTFRFIKNTLGWTTPSVCTPEQADRWTQMIAADYTQLRLAKPLAEDHRLPWEKPQPPNKLTPARTRRDFRRLRPALINPARPPKSQTPGPGRPKGTRTGPRPRHPPIKRAA
ncbi:MAG: NF041680 family putative transposase [Candidatus Microthrix parvicella]